MPNFVFSFYRKKPSSFHVQNGCENLGNNDFGDFSSLFQNKSDRKKKILRNPQVLGKHITWRNFPKESLARNKVLKKNHEQNE